jgi:hypothetical protein
VCKTGSKALGNTCDEDYECLGGSADDEDDRTARCMNNTCVSQSLRLPLWIWITVIIGCILVVAFVVLSCLCCKTASGSGISYLSKTDLSRRLDEFENRKSQPLLGG